MSLKSHWAFILLGAVSTMLAFAVALLSFILIYGPSRPIPVSVTPIDTGLSAPVCPDQNVRIISDVNVSMPTVMEIAISVMDSNLSHNIPGTQIRMAPRTHPVATHFRQEIEWTVPHLEPGDYNRVIALISSDGNTVPTFLVAPFHVKGDCNE